MKNVLKRIYRKILGRCIQCGRPNDGYWYCSITCSAYDGSVAIYWKNQKEFKDFEDFLAKDGLKRKPTVFSTNRTMHYIRDRCKV